MQYKQSQHSDGADRELVEESNGSAEHTPSASATKKESVSSSKYQNRSSAKSTPQMSMAHTVTPETSDDKVSVDILDIVV